MYNAREAAYLALLSALQEKSYIPEYLRKWQEEQKVSSIDFHLAQEIACGSMRMAKRLDFLAKQCHIKKNLRLKLREKTLLRTALYQFFFMDRIPIYAIVNETIKIAHKYIHSSFAHFLNAILRKLPETSFHIPTGNSIEDLSIRYSYPSFFVERLLAEYGEDRVENILSLGNIPPKVMARIRSNLENINEKDFKIISIKPFPMAVIENTEHLPTITKSYDYYIQNITPAYLIGSLCHQLQQSPKKILDLCASPGGKTLATFDLFPQAEFFANDISEFKMKKMRENFLKYSLIANLSCFPAEQLKFDQKFDVIIIDAPCSNSGVLNKRPEARWRITPEALKELTQQQISLIKSAIAWLEPHGQLWYMTCSLLKEENEEVINSVCKHFPLEQSGYVQTILPNAEGWDGGFACSLKLK